MKKCPQCGNMYDDEMNFCLTDGATLVSAEIPATQQFDEFETKVAAPLKVTIPPPVQTFAALNLPPAAPPRSNSVLLYLALPLLGVLIGGGLIWFLFTINPPNVAVNNLPNVNRTASNAETNANVPTNTEIVVAKTPNLPKNENAAVPKNGNLAVSTPTPTPPPTVKPTAKPTPTPTDKPTPTHAGCYLDDGGKGGGEVNVRKNCDYLDCENDAGSLAGTYPNKTAVKKLGGAAYSNQYTWLKILVGGQIAWVASSKIHCE